MINALLGGEYAATKVTPETASLTKFCRGEDNSIFLKEYTKLNAEKEKWIGHPDKTVVNSNPEMFITEIQKWTSSKSVFHYFVKEIEVALKKVATQLDTLTHPKTDWMEQKNEWIKYLERKSAYADPKLAEKNLIGVSAYLYILLTQYKPLTENDDRF